MLEHRPLLEADRNFHLIGESVLLTCSKLGALSLDHVLEVHVDLNTLQLVVSFALRFEPSGLFHLHSARVTVVLDLIDFVRGRDSSLQRGHLLSRAQLDHTVGNASSESAVRLLGLWLDTILLFEPILSFSGCAVSGQTLVLKLIEHGLGRHGVDLSLLLLVLEFSLLHYALYTGVKRIVS